MRRRFACALMIILCLSACKAGGDNSEQLALTQRTNMLAAGRCFMTAELSADYGDRVHEYTLSCEYVRNGDSVVTVIKPDIISGVSASISSGDSTLRFQDVSLDTGSIGDSGITPIGTLPAFARAWESGYINTTCYETVGDTECLLVSYLVGYDREETEYRTWFDKETMTPVKGEIYENGSVVIQCSFTGFQYGTEEKDDDNGATDPDMGGNITGQSGA